MGFSPICSKNNALSSETFTFFETTTSFSGTRNISVHALAATSSGSRTRQRCRNMNGYCDSRTMLRHAPRELSVVTRIIVLNKVWKQWQSRHLLKFHWGQKYEFGDCPWETGTSGNLTLIHTDCKRHSTFLRWMPHTYLLSVCKNWPTKVIWELTHIDHTDRHYVTTGAKSKVCMQRLLRHVECRPSRCFQLIYLQFLT